MFIYEDSHVSLSALTRMQEVRFLTRTFLTEQITKNQWGKSMCGGVRCVSTATRWNLPRPGKHPTFCTSVNSAVAYLVFFSNILLCISSTYLMFTIIWHHSTARSKNNSNSSIFYTFLHILNTDHISCGNWHQLHFIPHLLSLFTVDPHIKRWFTMLFWKPHIWYTSFYKCPVCWLLSDLVLECVFNKYTTCWNASWWRNMRATKWSVYAIICFQSTPV